MTSLSRATNGDWFARKGIPKDVRAAYKAAFGVSQEERFRRPGSLSTGAAKAELRDWDATVTGRIEALRAAARGEGQGLTPREAHGLAGQWYAWFLARHEGESLEGAGEDLFERLGAARSWGSDHVGAPGEADEEEESPAARRRRRGLISELGFVSTFLSESGIVNDNGDGRLYVRLRNSDSDRIVMVSRLVVDDPAVSMVRYRDGDRLNLRRGNLVAVKTSERPTPRRRPFLPPQVPGEARCR